jgi:hypothetical protein
MRVAELSAVAAPGVAVRTQLEWSSSDADTDTRGRAPGYLYFSSPVLSGCGKQAFHRVSANGGVAGVIGVDASHLPHSRSEAETPVGPTGLFACGEGGRLPPKKATSVRFCCSASAPPSRSTAHPHTLTAYHLLSLSSRDLNSEIECRATPLIPLMMMYH